MTCTDYQTTISQLLDNELSNDQQGGTFAHLSSCDDCREFFHASRFVRRHLEDAPAFPASVDQAILGMARRARTKKALVSRRVLIPLPAAAAVLLALAVSMFVSIDAYSTSDQPEEQVIYVPTLPEIEVEATLATNQQSEEALR